jgi:hypothetical protein
MGVFITLVRRRAKQIFKLRMAAELLDARGERDIALITLRYADNLTVRDGRPATCIVSQKSQSRIFAIS